MGRVENLRRLGKLLKNSVLHTSGRPDLSIQRLLGKKTLEEIQDKIAQATGLALVSVDYRGEPITELTSFTPFCQQVRNDEHSCRICKQSDAFGAIQAAVTQKRCVFLCPCGLLEVAVPFIIRGQYMGGVLGGQLRCINAPQDIPRLEAIMPSQKHLLKNEKMKELYRQIPEISYERFASIADLVSMIVNQFAEKEIARLQQGELLQRKIHNLSKQKSLIKKENELKNTELSMFRARMNPFFIFRSLSTISNLSIMEDALKTNEVVSLVAEFLHATLNNMRHTFTVAEECDVLERYLQIQKVRLGDKLSWIVAIADNIHMQPIPSMILLPFVERALHYGVAQKREHCSITVSVQYQGDDVVVRVEDDGPGLSSRMISDMIIKYKEGCEGQLVEMGISNARERLLLAFGQKYNIAIQNTAGKGTVSVIRYPKDYGEKVI